MELCSRGGRCEACFLAGRRIGAIVGGWRLVESRCGSASSRGPLSQVGRFQGEGLLGLASSPSVAQGSWLDRRVVPSFSGRSGCWTVYSIANRTVRSAFLNLKATPPPTPTAPPPPQQFLL